MPQGEQDRWVGWMPDCGQIKVRGDVKVRLTLEDHFLDSVSRALQDSNHTRVQWCSFGKASEIVQHPFPEISSSSAHICDGGQPLDLALSLREHLQADVVQVRGQHPADILELLQSGGEIQVLGFLCLSGHGNEAGKDTSDARR